MNVSLVLICLLDDKGGSNTETTLFRSQAVTALFNSLDRVEEILSKQRYLAGNVLTEADVRLFMTLIRFDEVRIVSPCCAFGLCAFCCSSQPFLLDHFSEV